MALITTAMTGPLLKRVYSDRVMQRDIAAAERAALGRDRLLPGAGAGGRPQRARSMAAVGAALLGTGRPAELVLSRLIIRPKAPLEVGAALVPDLARMATTVDELNALAAELKARGVACSVLTRFSSDPWTDVAAQAAAVEANVVLVDSVFAEDQPEAADVDRSVHPGDGAAGRQGSRHRRPGRGHRGRARRQPDRVGSRLRRGEPPRRDLAGVAQDGGRAARKVAAALAPLQGAGLRVQLLDGAAEIAAAPLVLTGGASDAVLDPTDGGTVVTVQAGLDDREAELVEQLAKLAASG